jgi:hypothetical protein
MLFFNRKSHYPLVRYPREIEYISNLQPENYPAPVFNNETILPVEEMNIKYMFFGIIFLIIGIGNCNEHNRQNKNIGFALIVVAIILYLIHRGEISSHNLDKKRFKEKNDKRRKEKDEYKQKVEFYNNFVLPYLGLHDNNSLKKFRINLFINYFKKTKLAIKNINSRKGYTENSFYNFLKLYYGDSIKTNLGIETFDIDDKIGYVPDFVFYDKNSGLHIDIEIDEPYTKLDNGEKEVIHNLDNSKEKNRDSYFLSNQWVIIRFAEEQIVKNPEYCAMSLAFLIFTLLGDYKYLKKLTNDYKLPEKEIFINFSNITRWTYKDAEKMALDNYRQSYIKSI